MTISEALFSILKSSWHILLMLILFVVVTPILKKIFKPKIKGYIGEKNVALLLAALDKKKYQTINDLIIKIEGESTQIDHVVVSNYGIFVIETKNYKGWIVGHEYDNYWKQVIYKEKNNFLNPIKQNEYHVKFLKSALKIFPEVQYYPIVSFASGAEIKINTTRDVINEEFLLRTITKYRTEIISDDLKNEIFAHLKFVKGMNAYYEKEHIQNIKEKRPKINK